MTALSIFRRGRGRRFWLVGATLVAAASFGVVFVAASGAAPASCPPPGNFEIDGDMQQQTCSTPEDDWNTPGIGVQATSQEGTYQTSGKDPGNPSTWSSSGATPNKTDFAQAYATSRVVGGHFYVFVAWERTFTNGTQGYAIEITNSGSNVGSDGTPQPNRGGGGDVFYLSSQGSSQPTFDSACSYTSQSTYGQSCTNSSASVTAAMNTAQVSDPLNHTTQPAGGFYEVALDITQLTGIAPSCPGHSAASVYLRSITGQTHNGNLKGYVAPLDVAPDSTCVTPPISTTATPGGASNLPGATQHDEVTVGTPAAPAVGSVKFFLCSPAQVAANGGDCSANGTQVGAAVTLDSNGQGKSADVTGATTPSDHAVGTYCWRAEFTRGTNDHHYLSGTHTNHDSECFTIVKASPSITTVASVTGSGVVGSDSTSDSAIVSGGDSPTGSIQFSITAPDGAVSKVGSPVPVNGDGTYAAPSSVPLAEVGTYTWSASYSGDSLNNGAIDNGLHESVSASRAKPSITTTQVPASGSVGDTFRDKATLSGTFHQDGSGSITWTLYPNDDCTGTPLATKSVSVNADGTYETPTGVVLNSAGTYYWVAAFSGDSNNLSATSGCADEPVVVNGAVIHILKTADAAKVSAGDPVGFTMTVWNDGPGDAHGVTLSDTLPTNPGLSWKIAGTGAGWGSSCAINAGVLTCGPVTVPAGTTQAASTFTVHITSTTDRTTGGTCSGTSGVVDNTGKVATTNAGSGQSSASTCVAAPAIHIAKTADAAKVSVGDPIGFTVTVWNDGAGDAYGVKLNDTLPTNSGLSWKIDKTGSGWGSSCSISAGVLSCGGANGVTVPAGTTHAASTFTVHITSATTGATGGDCPSTGVVHNTGQVTTSNDGSGQSSASTCVQAVVDLSITKTGSPARQEGFGDITWTMVVTNNGPSDDPGVKVSDPMPAGNTFVSATSTKGTCTGGAILTCDIGDMTAGEKVTITLVTTPSVADTQTNTAVVMGARPETTLANNTATASVVVVAPLRPPHVFCVAVSRITPGHLIVGRKTRVTIHLTRGGKAVRGVRVRMKGPKLNVRTKRSNARGVIKRVVRVKRKGIVTFTPLTAKSCGKRIGVRGVFTPPVTG